MQLGCGFFTTRKEWAHVISHLYDSVNDSDGSLISGHQYNASHACGNGKIKLSDKASFNLFCILQESNPNNNNSRKICHETFAALGKADRDADMTCICVPGHTVPCLPGRSRQTHNKDLKGAFLAKFDENMRENDLGRCPYPSCNGKEIVQIRSLDDCFTAETAKQLAAHMKIAHRVVLQTLSPLPNGHIQEPANIQLLDITPDDYKARVAPTCRAALRKLDVKPWEGKKTLLGKIKAELCQLGELPAFWMYNDTDLEENSANLRHDIKVELLDLFPFQARSFMKRNSENKMVYSMDYSENERLLVRETDRTVKHAELINNMSPRKNYKKITYQRTKDNQEKRDRLLAEINREDEHKDEREQHRLTTQQTSERHGKQDQASHRAAKRKIPRPIGNTINHNQGIDSNNDNSQILPQPQHRVHLSQDSHPRLLVRLQVQSSHTAKEREAERVKAAARSLREGMDASMRLTVFRYHFDSYVPEHLLIAKDLPNGT